METITQMFDSLESTGLIALFIAILVKFVTGVAASVHEKDFQWSRFGDVLKSDMLKYVTVLVLVYMYREPLVITPVMTVLTADMAMGITRNLGRLFPSVGEALPNAVVDTSKKDEIIIQDATKDDVVEK